MAGRLVIVDLADLSIAGELVSEDLEGQGVLTVDATDSFVYVATNGGLGRLVSVDVRNKALPAVADVVEHIDLDGPTAIEYLDHVYVASSASGSILSYNYADPFNLSLQHKLTYPAFSFVADIAGRKNGMVGGFAACPDTTSLVSGNANTVFDELISASHFTGIVSVDSSVSGGVCYTVATGSQRLTTVDCFDIYNMSIIGYVESANFANATSVVSAGNYVYVTTSDGKILVVDVSDPRTPSIVVTYENPSALGEPLDVVVRDGDVYILDATGTLIHLDFSSQDLVSYGEYPFPYDGTYQIDPRLSITATGPLTVLAVTYEVDDTDNPTATSG